jgi:hypothetical protein
MALMLIILVTVGAMIFENSLIYFPDKDGPYEAKYEFPIHYVTFEASDGVKLHGAYCPVANARGTLMWCHGNAGNLAQRLETICELRRLGVSVFIFDYRGFGRSEGSPNGEGIMLDAEAAYAYVIRELKVPPSRLVLLGESLGGAPAIRLAARGECAGLITQSTFTSIRDMAGVVLPYFPWLRFIVRTNFPNLDTIGSVKVPKLMIHSRTDEMIPFWMGEKLFAAAAEPKEFWVIERAGHNDTFGLNEYPERMESFLRKVLPK